MKYCVYVLKRCVLAMCFVMAGGTHMALAASSSGAEYRTGVAYEHCAKGDKSFERWKRGLIEDVLAAGISKRSASMIKPLKFDKRVISRDRQQGFFNQDFLTFVGKVVSNYRYKKAKELMKRHSKAFSRVEASLGIPPAVLLAFWGLESDFGGNMGKFDTLRSLVTLAFDCRRPGLFRPEVVGLLTLFDKGDISPSEAVGAWAGELGQTQLLPSDYDRFARDFDGDGVRDLIGNSVDVIGSSAQMIASHGWSAGEPWLVEVKLGRALDWSRASLDTLISVSEWQRNGVTLPQGGELPMPNLNARLILPMGHKGPAFLAYPNFDVYLEWNQSLTYALAAAYFATRLDGAPRLNPRDGKRVAIQEEDVKRLQRSLIKRGYDVGGADGTLGYKSRNAVRQEQKRLGYPVDGYPSHAFIHDVQKGK